MTALTSASGCKSCDCLRKKVADMKQRISTLYLYTIIFGPAQATRSCLPLFLMPQFLRPSFLLSGCLVFRPQSTSLRTPGSGSGLNPKPCSAPLHHIQSFFINSGLWSAITKKGGDSFPSSILPQPMTYS